MTKTLCASLKVGHTDQWMVPQFTVIIGEDETIFLGEDEYAEMTMSIPVLRGIQILDAAEIVSYQTVMVVGLCSHVIYFENGGLFQFAFNHRGRIVGLLASNSVQTLSEGNDLLYRMRL